MFNSYELLLGLVAIIFAIFVVYYAFKLENQKSKDKLAQRNELIKEMKSIKEILNKINDKIN